MFVVFSFLCILPNLGITVINKFNTNKHNEFIVSFIKGVYYILLSFLFVCLMGNVEHLFDAFKTPQTSIFIIANGLTMGISWALYFAAFARSPMGLFTITNLSSSVLMSSAFSFVLSMDIVTNGRNPLNMSLYLLAICLLVGLQIAIALNKESKENGSRIWIIFSLLNGLVGAINNLIFMNKFLAPAGILEDCILFYQAIGVTVVSIIISSMIKKVYELKTFNGKEHIFLAISSLLELLYYFLYAKAINSPGANHAIVSIIASAGLFLLVEVAEIVFFKKRPKKYHLILLLVFVSAMVLECLAGII